MFKELLVAKKSVIVQKWIEQVLKTYSSETSNFLKLEKNQFSNPVGFTIRSNAEVIFNEFIAETNFEKISSALNDIIKIRAIQDFSPSKAVAFVLLLKKIIYDELEDDLKDKDIFYEFLRMESIIDRIALMAFDLYMDCREKVNQIRINQIKSGSISFMDKIGNQNQ